MLDLLFLLTLLVVVILVLLWVFAPIWTNLTSDYEEFEKIYPNKYKQLLVMILHGPMTMICFGYNWITTHLFVGFRNWLKK